MNVALVSTARERSSGCNFASQVVDCLESALFRLVNQAPNVLTSTGTAVSFVRYIIHGSIQSLVSNKFVPVAERRMSCVMLNK
jgi:hypothetical protein